MKTCLKCEILKEDGDFYHRPGYPTKLRPYCKQCDAEDAKLRYHQSSELRTKIAAKARIYKANNRDKVNAQAREYGKRPEVKESRRLWTLDNYHNNPEYKAKRDASTTKYRHTEQGRLARKKYECKPEVRLRKNAAARRRYLKKKAA